jgi:hypothetical protein
MSEGGALPVAALRAAAAALAAALPPGALAAFAPGAPPAGPRPDPDAWGFAHAPPLEQLLAVAAADREAGGHRQQAQPSTGAGEPASAAGPPPLPPPGPYLEALAASRTFALPHSLDAMARALGVGDLLRGMAGSAAAGDGLLPPPAARAGGTPGSAAPAAAATPARQQQEQLSQQQPEPGSAASSAPQQQRGREPEGAQQKQREGGAAQGAAPAAAPLTAEAAVEALRRRIDGAWSQEAVRRGVAFAKAGARRARPHDHDSQPAWALQLESSAPASLPIALMTTLLACPSQPLPRRRARGGAGVLRQSTAAGPLQRPRPRRARRCRRQCAALCRRARRL